MVFVGNTQHTVPYMLKHTDLFDELRKNTTIRLSSTASIFTSRLGGGYHRGEMFSDGYGFVVDYLAGGSTGTPEP